MANNDKFNKDIPPIAPDKISDIVKETAIEGRLLFWDQFIFGISGYHSPSMKRVHPLKLIELLNQEEEKKFKRNGTKP